MAEGTALIVWWQSIINPCNPLLQPLPQAEGLRVYLGRGRQSHRLLLLLVHPTLEVLGPFAVLQVVSEPTQALPSPNFPTFFPQFPPPSVIKIPMEPLPSQPRNGGPHCLSRK